MKKILLFAVPVFLFAACNPVTEIAVKNGEQPDDNYGSISTIIWENNSNQEPAVTWGEEVVQVTQTSSSKETDTLDGKVLCSVDDGTGNFVESGVFTVNNGSGQSASLNEGESNTLVLRGVSAIGSIRTKKNK